MPIRLAGALHRVVDGLARPDRLVRPTDADLLGDEHAGRHADLEAGVWEVVGEQLVDLWREAADAERLERDARAQRPLKGALAVEQAEDAVALDVH